MSDEKIVVSKDGPYVVIGTLPLKKEIAEVGKSGQPEHWVDGGSYPLQTNNMLCRCGESKDKPYCDGTHTTIGFDGTETADRRPFADRAEKLEGPQLDMLDVLPLCSGARFCDPHGSIWNLVPKSDDPAARAMAIEEAGNCPSGRLVVGEKAAGTPIEPIFHPSISVLEDPQVNMSGPLWVKGGVPVESADGSIYERRNRVTLCRCGKSAKKPFCDGNHLNTRFNDGDASVKE